jgi:hypothetical protein
MLIERDQKIGFIASRQHFTGTDADLKDRWSTGDCGRDRHVGHDVLVAASGEAGEKRAGSLNSVLRITSETNHGVLNIFRAQIGTVRTRTYV